jgi:hypothetical protein
LSHGDLTIKTSLSFSFMQADAKAQAEAKDKGQEGQAALESGESTLNLC